MTVEVVAHEGWAELILNRPERKNAVTGPLGVELARQVNVLAADDDVRVILLRGAEGAFCSGLDLKEFNADPAPDWLADFARIWRSVHRALFNCTKPIVGALERYAINGGAALALACDLLVVGEEAFLQVGEVQQGMAAPYNIAWLNLRHSEAVAAQIALVGRRLHGRELVGLGAAYRCACADLRSSKPWASQSALRIATTTQRSILQATMASEGWQVVRSKSSRKCTNKGRIGAPGLCID